MSDTETLVKALRILARDIESGDGVANAAIAEAAGQGGQAMSDTHGCYWIVAGAATTTRCGAPASHQCKESGAYFCELHAEDYSDEFGQEILRELPIRTSQEDKP